MSNPSDPHRHHGDDLPRDTDAFEDTEFSMGTKDANDATATSDGGSTGAPAGSSSGIEGAEGYDAEVASSGDVQDDTTGSEGDREVIDAESTEVTDDEPLGSARDPEVTGIIPVVNDDRISEHEQRLAESNENSDTTVIPTAGPAESAGAAGAASTTDGDASSAPTPAAGSGGDSGGPPPGSGSRPWYARFPTWGWILIIGLGLSVIGAATAVALMRTGDGEERHSPYSSVVPNYPRPEAWDSSSPIPSAQPDNSAGTDYYYEPEYDEPEEYTPYTPDESEDAAPSSQAPAPSEQNPGNGGNGSNNGNGGNTGGNNGGNNGGGNQTTPGGGNGGDGNGGGNNGGGNGNGGGNNGGTEGGTEGGGGNTGPGTGDGDGAAEE
ncbi:Putative membrane protein [Corynebacterium glyciniphilum AJ 3170]|uniref:Putative membrane protein n=1 Tax=Corynebacterium glyciniphilum AJ 3170 TaxID=1404245 RepID=X5EDB4_9CORY|nr:hypothetical protein [Corynebacterium glyciniphilum]AHW65370.1 Putative membrane protein [Corynebacterium glyciniphilum AJ 3170]